LGVHDYLFYMGKEIDILDMITHGVILIFHCLTYFSLITLMYERLVIHKDGIWDNGFVDSHKVD
jgi:hypothetical protein